MTKKELNLLKLLGDSELRGSALLCLYKEKYGRWMTHLGLYLRMARLHQQGLVSQRDVEESFYGEKLKMRFFKLTESGRKAIE